MISPHTTTAPLIQLLQSISNTLRSHRCSQRRADIRHTKQPIVTLDHLFLHHQPPHRHGPRSLSMLSCTTSRSQTASSRSITPSVAPYPRTCMISPRKPIVDQQDPVSVLDVWENTLGNLYIMCVDLFCIVVDTNQLAFCSCQVCMTEEHHDAPTAFPPDWRVLPSLLARPSSFSA